MNNIVISGRLTKDNELRSTQTGITVLCNTLAVRRTKEETDFIDFTAFKNNAEFLNRYTHKGDQVILNGELRIDKYTAQDGTNRLKPYVLVNTCELCGSKKEEKEKAETQPNDNTPLEFTDDDLPF